MGESLYGQGDYGDGEYSYSIYIPLSGTASVAFAVYPPALSKTLSLEGSTSLTLSTLDLGWDVIHVVFLEGGLSLAFDTAQAVLSRDIYMSGLVELDFSVPEPRLNRLVDLGGVYVEVMLSTNPAAMYGGPFWVDDVPQLVTWTPIEV